MDKKLDSVVKSLSGNSNELLPFLPYLLQDLFELGGEGNFTVKIIENNFISDIQNFNVLDLCCGKGAILIQLSQKFNCKCTGIDLLSSFIDDAKKYSSKLNLRITPEFYVMNLIEAVDAFKNFDIVLFGNDTDVLGDEIQSLEKIKNCCRPNGYIIFDYLNILDSRSKEEFAKIGLKVIDSLLIEKAEITKINKENNNKIKSRTGELIEKYPHRKNLFDEYVKSQERESLEFEQELSWTKLLLQKI